jgi:CheY-like chemotaxis protein
MEEDVRRAFDSGMNAHLGKPIELAALYAVLDGQMKGSPPKTGDNAAGRPL